MDRSKFVYKLHNSQGGYYGITTDIYMLPVNTKFTVSNGAWDGEIIEKHGSKYLHVIDTGKLVELKEDGDYGLVITVK